jgi:hypothetical protein
MKHLLFLVALVLIVLVGIKRSEGFGATSPGTMVQLSTSHVTTQEDIDYLQNEYPKKVRREIYNMTESDLY